MRCWGWWGGGWGGGWDGSREVELRSNDDEEQAVGAAPEPACLGEERRDVVQRLASAGKWW